MTAVAGAALTAAFVLGIVLVIYGAIPSTPAAPRTRVRGVSRANRLGLSRRERLVAAAAFGLGVLLAALQGWFVLLFLLPVAAVGLPRLLRPPARETPEQLEAIEAWVRDLHGHLTTNPAITASILASKAEPPLTEAVDRLKARLAARAPLPAALDALADDLASTTGDYAVMALKESADVSGAGLTRTLGALADDITREVRLRREIAVTRARTFQSVRYVTLIYIAIVVGLVLSPAGTMYRTPLGQLVLAVLVAAFAACLMWLRQRAVTTPSPRLLVTTSSGDPS